ncbi:MAG: transglutaminase family protein [Lacipirellulaceae bacterium]
MRYRITHATRYAGKSRVSVGYNELWLRPLDDDRQTVQAHSLRVTPLPSVRNARRDYFGNHVVGLQFHEGYASLEVTATTEVEVQPQKATVADAAGSPPWESVAGPTAPQKHTLDQFRFPSPRAPAFESIDRYAAESFTPGRPVLAALLKLNARVHEDFEYDPSATHVGTPVEEAFDLGRGVCQDFAHVMIAAARSVRLPARYVSGYLRTLPPPGKPRLVGADASHAWASVYCGDDLGWVEFDPTNDTIVGTDHVVTARGRDYADVPPLRGVFLGGGHPAMHVSVDVAPLEAKSR